MLNRIPLTVVFLLLASSLTAAQSGNDEPQHFGITDDSWRGATRLVEIAAEMDIRVDLRSEIDLMELAPGDALLILHPTDHLPAGDIADFVRAGGRVAVADDFGTGDEVFAAFGLRLGPYGASPATPTLRGNDNLPIARAYGQHPLTDGVQSLVTNHPATLTHPNLEPIFGFEEGGAIAYAGAIEEGRFVAFSDPSLFINNMMEFRGNERLARNLLRYLGAAGGVVWIAAPPVQIRGSTSAAGRAARLETWLEEASAAEMPPGALWILASVLLVVAVLLTTTMVRGGSPYSEEALLPPPFLGTGIEQQVRFYESRGAPLVYPAISYRRELEKILRIKLSLPTHLSLGALESRLRAAGVPAKLSAELKAALLTLREFEERHNHPSPPKIDAAQLSKLIKTGEQTLAALEAAPP